MKKIKSKALDILVHKTEDGIVPSSTVVPEWFKKIPAEYNDFDSNMSDQYPTLFTRFKSTVKKCVPFLDTLTSGYMICFPQDIEVVNINGECFINYGIERNTTLFFDKDLSFRSSGIPTPALCLEQTWRFHTAYTVKTPKNYSILITHPLNRFDLPFNTLSGIIDSDKYNRDLVITFFIRSDFNGIIEKGTPIAQIIPIKRDRWSMKKEKPGELQEQYVKDFAILSKINRAYQSLIWTKKVYK
jgi:hypothetical protein